MRVAVLGCALTICLTNGLSGQEVYREEFEGDSVSWRPEGGDAPYQMTDHQRVSDIAHTGQGSERIRLVASNGTAIYLSHGIPAGSVIGELTSSVWIRSDRPGIQLLLRVVFPRTTDPQTGRPVVTFLRGPASNYSNDWQKLSIDNIPTRIERHLHALRHELQLNIDPREAYVNQAYLNVYGGTGATTVWVDDLQFSGIVRPKALRPSSSLPLVRDNQGKFLLTAEANTKTKIHDVQFQGTVLTVDGRSICPRAIQYQGEPLVHLKQLGFNAVCLSTPPSTTLLAEARQADIWLIAPPPNSLSSPPKIVARPFDPVLAWDLGRRLSRHDLTSLQKLAQHVRGSDPHPGRPILGGVDTELLGYSRTLDILIIGLNPWGTSLELNDYTTWIGQRPRLARPGTPIWAHIQTQTDPRVEEQWETLLESPKIHASVEQNQIEQLTRIGLAAGAHGFFFDSHSPLTAKDRETRRRALILELINLELDLIAPWAAGGVIMTRVISNDPQIKGWVLHSQKYRARLLIPIQFHSQKLQTSATKGPDDVSFVIPGIPESNDAYEMTLVGLRRLRHRRVSGGIRVTMENLHEGSLVLLTQNPVFYAKIGQRISQLRTRAAQIQHDLVAEKIGRVERTNRFLPDQHQQTADSAQLLSTAKTTLWQSKLLLDEGRPQASYHKAKTALVAVGQVQQRHWQWALERTAGNVTSPFTANYAMLLQNLSFLSSLPAGRLGENRLPAGDFEDQLEMHRTGWQHISHPLEHVQTDAELSTSKPHLGRYSLKLRVKATNPVRPHYLLETAPMWVSTPPIKVQKGELLQIHGWVRIPEPISGSVDGLLIMDSFTGDALAERIGHSPDWREFFLYRVATQDGCLTVTFALSGLGEAWLDDVTIAPVTRATGGQLPQARLSPKSMKNPLPR